MMIEPVTTNGYSAAELITKLKANDEQALKYLYQLNYSKTASYIVNNNGTAEDAKDIYQEAFIAVWRNIQLDKIVYTTENDLQAYLYKVAQYKWLDKLRKDKRHPTGTLGEMNIADEHAANFLNGEAEDYLGKVKHHFAAMGEPCKELLQRFYFLRQSMNEIGSHFSWTDATAKNNKYRCLQKLRSLILTPKK